jgi:hypothetical protein
MTTDVATGSGVRTDRGLAWALVLAVAGVLASLTFFWLYALPPLLFIVPSAVLARRRVRAAGTMSPTAAVTTGLLVVAVLCDVTFLLINIHHLY